MQFGGQHPGGIGVPAVGMAFPGYVGNPALGNSEMTWYDFKTLYETKDMLLLFLYENKLLLDISPTQL